MSVEAPEAHIISEQMNSELHGKMIKTIMLRNYEKLQRIGFMNRDVSYFDQLKNRTIKSVISRGNVIRMKLDKGMNLLLSPEYGGKILLHASKNIVPSRFHVRIDFDDGTCLTVTLSGMGVIQALGDSELGGSYVYKRDFSAVASPLNEEEFTFRGFSEQLAKRNVNIKSVLVGKDAVLVGLSNSLFQDVIYRAGIHPKSKASDLSPDEQQALFTAIKLVVKERIRLGGKDQFVDLHGKHGRYVPAVGPGMKNKACQKCGTPIEKLSLGGGHVYFCPKCQKIRHERNSD
jgi:formamidopyrimidine-DNA glycosylase